VQQRHGGCGAMEAEDKAEVKSMIEKHFKYTGSDPAEWILGKWEEASELFVKVMPKDYKAVLQKAKASKVASKAKVVDRKITYKELQKWEQIDGFMKFDREMPKSRDIKGTT
jgi:hypothetical protein